MIDVSETCIEWVTHRVGTKLYHDAWKKGRQPYGLCKEIKTPKHLYIQIPQYVYPQGISATHNTPPSAQG